MAAITVGTPHQINETSLLEKIKTPLKGTKGVTSLALKIIASVGAFLSKIPEQLGKISFGIKVIKEGLDLIDIVSTIKFWACEFSAKTTSKLKLITNIFSTALTASGVLSFLQTVKAVDFNRICGAIGTIPIFGTVVSSIFIITSSFFLANECIRLKDTTSKIKEIEMESTKLQSEKEALAKDSPERENLMNRVMNLSKKLEAAKIERTKAILGVTYEVLKIALAIVSLAALCFGIAASAPVSLPLLFFGLALSAYGLAKFIYETRNPKPVSESAQ